MTKANVFDSIVSPGLQLLKQNFWSGLSFPFSIFNRQLSIVHYPSNNLLSDYKRS